MPLVSRIDFRIYITSRSLCKLLVRCALAGIISRSRPTCPVWGLVPGYCRWCVAFQNAYYITNKNFNSSIGYCSSSEVDHSQLHNVSFNDSSTSSAQTYPTVYSIGELLPIGIPTQRKLILLLFVRSRIVRLRCPPSQFISSSPRCARKIYIVCLPDEYSLVGATGNKRAIRSESKSHNRRAHSH